MLLNLQNIEYFTDGNGQIRIGQMGPARCAAVVSDGGNSLATLVRKEA